MEGRAARRRGLGMAAVLLVLAASLQAAAPGLAGAAAAAGATLGMSRDARSQPLGPGFVAAADGAGGVHVNPAGLAGLERPELSAFYSAHVLDSRVTSLSVAHPRTALGGIGLGYSSFASGGFDGRDAEGNPTGRFSAEDRVIHLSAANGLDRLGGRFLRGSAAGATVKLFQSRLGDARAQSLALDLGATRRLGRAPLTLGAAVRNIGPGLRYGSASEPLPLDAAFGAAYAIPGAPARLYAGVSRGVRDGRLDAGFSLETVVGGFFSLRGGYQISDAGRSNARAGGPAAGLAAGFGVRLADCQVDGSMSPMGELGNVARFNFTMRFGGRGAPSAAPAGRPARSYLSAAYDDRQDEAGPRRRSGQSSAGNRRLNNTRVIQRRAPARADGNEDLWRGGMMIIR